MGGVRIHEPNRFSVFVRPDDAQGLDTLSRWLGWFQQRGIACVIVETDRGIALYRDGLDETF
jgi:hypothetical protein